MWWKIGLGFLGYGLMTALDFVLIWIVVCTDPNFRSPDSADNVVISSIAALLWPITIWISIGLVTVAYMRQRSNDNTDNKEGYD